MRFFYLAKDSHKLEKNVTLSLSLDLRAKFFPRYLKSSAILSIGQRSVKIYFLIDKGENGYFYTPRNDLEENKLITEISILEKSIPRCK
ncbi:MAG TPA: hypothetical protein P5059_02490 [Candidatus Dojkabacteria bacterium]|nr:hypothetical protein [Candidatus Dojkabacteria bacterium]